MPTFVEILDFKGLVDKHNIYRYGYLYKEKKPIDDTVYIKVINLPIRQLIVQGVEKKQIRVLSDKEAFLLSMKDPVFNQRLYGSNLE
jgi:hypothetical protein